MGRWTGPNFFAGWANTFTFGGYGALMRYTGGSYFINTGSTADSSGSLIGGIHQSLLTSNAMTSYSCATWIGKIARLGEFYNATNDFAEAIVAGARIYYDPQNSSGWDYLTVIMGVSGFANLRNMSGCFVVDTPVATGWGEYHADVVPAGPGPDDDWSLTWLSLGAGCIALVVTTKQRRRQEDEGHPADAPKTERIAPVPDDNYRLDPLFARWQEGEPASINESANIEPLMAAPTLSIRPDTIPVSPASAATYDDDDRKPPMPATRARILKQCRNSSAKSGSDLVHSRGRLAGWAG